MFYKFKLTALLMFIGICCSGNKEIILPFNIINNYIVVNIITHNISLNLLFDTGSNLSLIDSTLAKDLDLNFGARIPIMSRINSIPCYDTNFVINDTLFSLLKWRIANLKIDTSRFNHIDGLLGAYSLIKNNYTEIDFKNQVIKINNKSDKKCNLGKSFDLIDINKPDGLGKYMPKLPAIQDTIKFASSAAKLVDLIIDTGSKYGLAFTTGDSLIIEDIISFKDNYKIIGKNKEIGFSKACWINCDSLSFDAPLFFSPLETEIKNNNFYGLIGIPILKKFDKIIFDYDKNKILFIN